MIYSNWYYLTKGSAHLCINFVKHDEYRMLTIRGKECPMPQPDVYLIHNTSIPTYLIDKHDTTAMIQWIISTIEDFEPQEFDRRSAEYQIIVSCALALQKYAGGGSSSSPLSYSISTLNSYIGWSSSAI